MRRSPFRWLRERLPGINLRRMAARGVEVHPQLRRWLAIRAHLVHANALR
jgi:hypothetical protein